MIRPKKPRPHRRFDLFRALLGVELLEGRASPTDLGRTAVANLLFDPLQTSLLGDDLARPSRPLPSWAAPPADASPSPEQRAHPGAGSESTGTAPLRRGAS